MFDFKKITGLAVAAVLASAVGVQASPYWTISGTALPGGLQASPNIVTSPNGGFNPALAATATAHGIGIGTPVTIGSLALAVDAVSLTFAYLGKEAGATNAAFSVFGGAAALFNNSNTATIVRGPFEDDAPYAAGSLAFRITSSFSTGAFIDNGAGTSGGTPAPQLAFYLSPTDSKRVYWFFDDGGIAENFVSAGGKLCASGDCDFDDMWGYIEMAPIPLPAAAWLMIAGLGGLGLVARRRKTTEA